MQNGEELTIDCTLGNRALYSSFWGNVVGRALLRNSDFADFYLLPGENKISAYVYTDGAPTITASMVWPITHWSAEGSAT